MLSIARIYTCTCTKETIVLHTMIHACFCWADLSRRGLISSHWTSEKRKPIFSKTINSVYFVFATLKCALNIVWCINTILIWCPYSWQSRQIRPWSVGEGRRRSIQCEVSHPPALSATFSFQSLPIVSSDWVCIGRPLSNIFMCTLCPLRNLCPGFQNASSSAQTPIGSCP